MTEYELYQKIKEALQLIEDYNAGKIEKRLINLTDWREEISTSAKDLIQKSFVLGASGRPCSKCGGSGIEN